VGQGLPHGELCAIRVVSCSLDDLLHFPEQILWGPKSYSIEANNHKLGITEDGGVLNVPGVNDEQYRR